MPTGCDQGACASKYMYSAVRIVGTATAARQTERQNAHAPGCSRLPMVRNPASMQCTRAHHQLKTPEWGAHVLDNTPPCGREPPKMQTERGSCSAGCKRGGKHKVEDALCNLRIAVSINRGRHGIPHSTHNVASTAAARRGGWQTARAASRRLAFAPTPTTLLPHNDPHEVQTERSAGW